MDKEVQNKFNEALESLGVENASRGMDWNGYEVYIPDTSKLGTYIGYPLVILVKGNEVRISDPDESIEYLDSLNKKAKKAIKKGR